MPKENKKINSLRKKIVKKRGPRKSTSKKKVVSKKAVQKKDPSLENSDNSNSSTITNKSIKAKKVVPPTGKNSVEKTSAKRKRRSSLISFTMEDVFEILKQNQEESTKNVPLPLPQEQKKKITEIPRAKTRLVAASLSDILGYTSTPDKPSKNLSKQENVPDKWKKFYQLLVDFRSKIQKELAQRTKDTLKCSAKEDSGDLSSYGQHMGDAGTEMSDRDLALSLVSSEQITLKEVNAAIERIHSGTYGICEVTEQPIDHERLYAIPYTRYSIEGQKQKESNSKKPSFLGGVFARSAEDSAEFSIEEE